MRLFPDLYGIYPLLFFSRRAPSVSQFIEPILYFFTVLAMLATLWRPRRFSRQADEATPRFTVHLFSAYFSQRSHQSRYLLSAFIYPFLRHLQSPSVSFDALLFIAQIALAVPSRADEAIPTPQSNFIILFAL